MLVIKVSGFSKFSLVLPLGCHHIVHRTGNLRAGKQFNTDNVGHVAYINEVVVKIVFEVNFPCIYKNLHLRFS